MATRRRIVTGFTLVRFMRQMPPISLIVAIQRGHGAPGVKEKVLDTVIARGYVVPGGYSLEPCQNCEWRRLLQSLCNKQSIKIIRRHYREKNVHMYLVTINAKNRLVQRERFS